LLNADDLDAMWVCLRENCVIDDATGAEKVCHYYHVFASYLACALLAFALELYYRHSPYIYFNLFLTDEL
jgi:hypothetical protein